MCEDTKKYRSAPEGRTLSTRQQIRYLYYLCSEHLLRPQTVSRQIMGLNLDKLSRSEASELLGYLEGYRESQHDVERGLEIEKQLGLSLLRVEHRDKSLTSATLVLTLLAVNRVATLGQLNHYLHGANRRSDEGDLAGTRALLRELAEVGLVGLEEGVALPAFDSGGARANIYYLTEAGSDAVHTVVPHVNYHARPGLPHKDRIQHELCVTEARLHTQQGHLLEDYAPETALRSEQEQKRRAAEREGRPAPAEEGCADFSAWQVNTCTSVGRRIEVEVCVDTGAADLAAKPRRVNLWYAATQYKADLIETSLIDWARGDRVYVVGDPWAPEQSEGSPDAVPESRSTISQERRERIIAALALMGVGSPDALAELTGYRAASVSDLLTKLEAGGQIARRDGVPLRRGLKGRPYRLYCWPGSGAGIDSAYEFSRLLLFNQVVSSRAVHALYHTSLWLVAADAQRGTLLYRPAGGDLTPPVLVIVDDPAEAPGRVAVWAAAADRRVREDAIGGNGCAKDFLLDEDHVLVVT